MLRSDRDASLKIDRPKRSLLPRAGEGLRDEGVERRKTFIAVHLWE